MALLAKTLDLHQLQAPLAPRRLEGVRTSAHDDAGKRRRTVVDDGAGAPRGLHRVLAGTAQDPGECEVRALQAAQDPGRERGGRVLEGLDELVGVLVALASLPDAAMHDLLQMIAAAQRADLARADAGLRVPLHEHRQELPDLVDIVARLPLGGLAVDELAGRHVGVERARHDPLSLALIPDDAEIAQLEPLPFADEDVQRGQIAMKEPSAMQLLEDRADAGDLAPRGALPPALLPARAPQIGAEVAVERVLEHEVEEGPAVPSRKGEAIEEADGPGMVLEELAEVRLPDPAVDVRADLDADQRRHGGGAADPAREVDLPESAGPREPVDAVAQARLRAGDLLAGREEICRGGRGL